jgi:hypothetical protein
MIDPQIPDDRVREFGYERLKSEEKAPTVEETSPLLTVTTQEPTTTLL